MRQCNVVERSTLHRPLQRFSILHSTQKAQLCSSIYLKTLCRFSSGPDSIRTHSKYREAWIQAVCQARPATNTPPQLAGQPGELHRLIFGFFGLPSFGLSRAALYRLNYQPAVEVYT